MEDSNELATEKVREREMDEVRAAPGMRGDAVPHTSTATHTAPVHARSTAHSTPRADDEDVDVSDNSEDENYGEDDEENDNVSGMCGVASRAVAASMMGRGIGAGAAGVGADGSAPIRYDPLDHTTADASPALTGSRPGVPREAPPEQQLQQRRRVWVLPRAVLTPSATDTDTSAAAAAGRRDVDGQGGGACASTRSSTQSAGAAPSNAVPRAPSAAHEVAGHAEVMRRGAGGVLNACVVRLPHPRHGQPFLCLVTRGTTTNNTGGGASEAASCVFELQAQAPPGGFAQSWFVGERVVPSSDGDLLVATPLDVSFFALHELLGDAARAARRARTFMSADDLFHASEGGGAATAAAAPATSPSPFASVFGDVGGADDDDEDSDPFSRSAARCGEFASRAWGAEGRPAHERTSGEAVSHHGASGREVGARCGSPASTLKSITCTQWPGWARAAAALPCTLHACYAALRADRVLRRVCEVREVGEGEERTVYYRPSDAVAVAWLRRKVEAVRAAEVMRRLLQLPEPSASTSDAAAVPMRMAFGVVAEYVPTRLHAALAVACGLPDPATGATAAVAVAPTSSAPSGAAPASTTREAPASLAVTTAAKSASVKRLEKAGRPKGTPTLFDMFAKKKPRTE